MKLGGTGVCGAPGDYEILAEVELTLTHHALDAGVQLGGGQLGGAHRREADLLPHWKSGLPHLV